MSERTPSGIEGLDELMGGGFPQGKNIIISGVPGSGKTTFGIEFLYKGATEYDDPGVFITLEESPESIMDNMMKIGMNLQNLISKRKILLIDTNPIRGETMITTTGQPTGFTEFKAYGLSEIIRQKVREIGAKRVVIDPLTALLMHYKDDFERRLEIARLLIGISNLNCTTLLTTEHRLYELSRQFSVEHSIADGVIILDMLRVSGGIIRGIQIQKIRGAKHDFDFHLYHITDKGIVVFPKEKIHAPIKGES
ncbi:MAG: circadian clock protein KaiC [archaeon]|nr:circadian clock protein KaiC [archaeon]MCP8306445.1 circadian clock protein KaiC [archaeon]